MTERKPKSKSKAINLLSRTWCVGNLTRMFSAFNYSPKSQSPTRIKSFFKVKWSGDRRTATWEITDISAYNRNDCVHQSGTQCDVQPVSAVCQLQKQFNSYSNSNSDHPCSREIRRRANIVDASRRCQDPPSNIQLNVIFHYEDDEVQLPVYCC